MSEVKFIVGRFNPPTPGHLKMIIAAYEGQWENKSLFIEDELKSNTNKSKPPHIIFPTYSQDPKKDSKNKNPLDFDTKRKHLKKVIESGLKEHVKNQTINVKEIDFTPNLDEEETELKLKPNTIYINKTPKPESGRNIYGNPCGILLKLKEKYDNIHLICGKDRMDSYKSFQKYVKEKNKNYYVHALERDESGISATKIRENTLKIKDWKHLQDYVIAGLTEDQLTKLYDNVSKALGITHSKETINTRKNVIIDLNPGQKLENIKKEDISNLHDNTCEIKNTTITLSGGN